MKKFLNQIWLKNMISESFLWPVPNSGICSHLKIKISHKAPQTLTKRHQTHFRQSSSRMISFHRQVPRARSYMLEARHRSKVQLISTSKRTTMMLSSMFCNSVSNKLTTKPTSIQNRKSSTAQRNRAKTVPSNKQSMKLLSTLKWGNFKICWRIGSRGKTIWSIKMPTWFFH